MTQKPKYNFNQGLRMPMGFPADNLRSALNYQARSDDIFLVTYPKCGTTWSQYIILLLLNQGQPLLPEQNLSDVFPHLEEVGKEKVNQLPSPRLIKTHLSYERVPYNPQAKYIYVARNPFDCVVSLYHHTRGFIKHYDFANGTFEDFFECFIQGEVDFGDYFDHFVGWYSQKQINRFLLITYEHMHSDIRTSIKEIANFLGGEFLENFKKRKILDKVIEHSHFSQMAKDQQRWSSERPKDLPPFVRKGQVGDWKNYFSAEQEERLKQRFKEKTRDLEIDLSFFFS